MVQSYQFHHYYQQYIMITGALQGEYYPAYQVYICIYLQPPYMRNE